MIQKSKVVGYLATVPGNTLSPRSLYSFRLEEDFILRKVTVNVFDDVDGTAGINLHINNEYTIPDQEVGDGWFTGDNTTLVVTPGDVLKKGSVIHIIGVNKDAVDKHFYVLIELKYPEGVMNDASAVEEQ